MNCSNYNTLKTLLVVAFCSLFLNNTVGKTITQNLYINSGQMEMVKTFFTDMVTIPVLAFNNTPTFNAVSSSISAIKGDSLIIFLKNNDSRNHAFTIQNTTVKNVAVQSGQTVVIKTLLNKWGAFIFYDPTEFPKYSYLGLSGILAVEKSNTNYTTFFWNIKEHQVAINQQLSQNQMVNWETYYPDYYTVNGLSYPASAAKDDININGNVGDTIHIFMAGTGMAEHVVHTHGFHCKILYTSEHKMLVDSHKDSLPLGAMQAMVLELVLYKKGEYPVHDHNLLGMTGARMHPYGMMMLINVK